MGVGLPQLDRLARGLVRRVLPASNNGYVVKRKKGERAIWADFHGIFKTVCCMYFQMQCRSAHNHHTTLTHNMSTWTHPITCILKCKSCKTMRLIQIVVTHRVRTVILYDKKMHMLGSWCVTGQSAETWMATWCIPDSSLGVGWRGAFPTQVNITQQISNLDF